MKKSNLPNEKLGLQIKRKAHRGWLFGAYTFLFLWGMAFLVLYFTDRLPI